MREIISRLLTVLLGISIIFCVNTETVLAGESLFEAWERQKQTSAAHNYNKVPQLSEADINRMNQGKASFLYNEQGYLSFLRGKFSHEKITDTEKGGILL